MINEFLLSVFSVLVIFRLHKKHKLKRFIDILIQWIIFQNTLYCLLSLLSYHKYFASSVQLFGFIFLVSLKKWSFMLIEYFLKFSTSASDVKRDFFWEMLPKLFIWHFLVGIFHLPGIVFYSAITYRVEIVVVQYCHMKLLKNNIQNSFVYLW